MSARSLRSIPGIGRRRESAKRTYHMRWDGTGLHPTFSYRQRIEEPFNQGQVLECPKLHGVHVNLIVGSSSLLNSYARHKANQDSRGARVLSLVQVNADELVRGFPDDTSPKRHDAVRKADPEKQRDDNDEAQGEPHQAAHVHWRAVAPVPSLGALPLAVALTTAVGKRVQFRK